MIRVCIYLKIKGEDIPEFVPVEKLKKMIGRENGFSDWVLIDQDRINQFADITGQEAWIHVDIDRAKKEPFGGPVGHGDFLLSLIPVFNASAKYIPADVKMAVNCSLNKVRYIEEKQLGRFLLTTTHTIEIEGQEKPACIAESLAMLFFEKNDGSEFLLPFRRELINSSSVFEFYSFLWCSHKVLRRARYG